MQISEFDFEVPPDLIATEPLASRSEARMMVINRKKKTSQSASFIQLPEFLKPGDLVVINETRVVPARFRAIRLKTDAELEGLLLPSKDRQIRAWLRGKIDRGDEISIRGWRQSVVIEKNDREVLLDGDVNDLVMALEKHGEIPIPPYIVNERKRRESKLKRAEDPIDYQSVFARQTLKPSASGTIGFSSAAPTASLHFDEKLIQKLWENKIEIAPVTLHVGASTFMPIEAPTLEEHRLPFEIVSIPNETWQKIMETKARGGRVIALGTTVMRSLESAIRRMEADQSIDFYETDLFIRPSFCFKCVDGLITNFHWGRSSLLVLVATFLESQIASEVGVEQPKTELSGFWKVVYEQARAERYRFYSFGDGMLIL